jgi:hypothetical protein
VELRKMSRSPSIAPGDTRDIYLVLGDFGHLGRAGRQTDEAGADRSTLIRNLIEGQYENRVAFNTSEVWSRDVTFDIADKLRHRYIEYDDAPASLIEFLPTANQHWSHAMNDTILAYLVSLAIIAIGMFVITALSAASVVYISIGVPTFVVGLLSLLGELR